VLIAALAVVALVALLPASAAADGLPAVGVDANPVSVPGGQLDYQTEKAGKATRVVESARYGGELRARQIPGVYSIPAVAYDGSPSGLSADGRTLVLINPRVRFPRERTTFAVIDTRTLRVRRTIALRGDFSFDAISPNGRVMYLIEYLNPRSFTEYAVRAYNMQTQRLYKRPVVDPNESGEDMYGIPVSRVSSRDGRWHYTLYEARNHPFVHALDSEGRTAVCIDIEGGVKSVWDATLQPRGPRLYVVARTGQTLAEIDTRTHEVVWERPPTPPAKAKAKPRADRAPAPPPDASTSWLPIAGPIAALLLLAAATRRLARSKRRASEPMTEEWEVSSDRHAPTVSPSGPSRETGSESTSAGAEQRETAGQPS
jgi:hypothetical protein